MRVIFSRKTRNCLGEWDIQAFSHRLFLDFNLLERVLLQKYIASDESHLILPFYVLSSQNIGSDEFFLIIPKRSKTILLTTIDVLSSILHLNAHLSSWRSDAWLVWLIIQIGVWQGHSSLIVSMTQVRDQINLTSRESLSTHLLGIGQKVSACRWERKTKLKKKTWVALVCDALRESTPNLNRRARENLRRRRKDTLLSEHEVLKVRDVIVSLR